MGIRMSEAFPSKFLSAADLQGREVSVIIEKVVIETVGQGDDAGPKPIVYFKGKQKGLVLNKTNAGEISHAFGDDSDDWIGGEIIIFPTRVDLGGKMVDAIRVKIPPRRPDAARGSMSPPMAAGSAM